MTLDELLPMLNEVRARGGRHVALCPAHPDRSPSLQITTGDKGLLLKCWSGCTLKEICHSLGIEPKELFFDAPLPHGQRPTPKPPKLDRVALAFRFELAALDLRLRAERIISAGKTLDVSSLSDSELDRAMHAVTTAHDDEERAELFEHVADTLREREFDERTHRERQTRVA